MAPALAPLIASSSRSPSSSKRSSTPQVNAPKAPPPCSASESRRVSPDGSGACNRRASRRDSRSDRVSLSGPLPKVSAEPRTLRRARLTKPGEP